MSWPAWVLVICIAAAIVLMAYGAIRVMSAARIVKKHAKRMKDQPLLLELPKANGYVQRINDDVAGIEVLLVRANAAIRSINESLAEMRIPEAIASVRMAGAAIRLLFNHT